MSDKDLIDELLSEREDPSRSTGSSASPSRSESFSESGAGADGVDRSGGSAPHVEPPALGTESGGTDGGSSPETSPGVADSSPRAFPPDPHFKPDFGTKLGKGREKKKGKR